VDALGTTAIGTQTVNISGAVYNYATASAAAPDPVNFADRHVGDVLSQALSIENAGTVDGFTEKLDASIGGATGAASASGSFIGLGAGVTNASSLVVGLGSAHDGAQSGTATITLTSDGALIDTLGTTALAAQTVTVEGTFYNYATASAAAPNPVEFRYCPRRHHCQPDLERHQSGDRGRLLGEARRQHRRCDRWRGGQWVIHRSGCLYAGHD